MWDMEAELNFLEFYQNEPVLWDPTHTSHKDKKRVHDAWVRLSVQTGYSIADLKKKKDSLMATYRGHIRKIKNSQHSGAGSDDIYKPVWFAFDLMNSFLANIYDCNQTKQTERQDILSEQNTHEDNVTTQPNETEEPGGGENTTIDQTSFAPPTQRRRMNPPELLEAGKNMSQAISSLNKVLNRKDVTPPPADDDFDRYGKILANKLRKLPELESMKLMYEIDGLLIEKMHQLQNYSRPSTSHYYVPFHTPSPQSTHSEPIRPHKTPVRPSSSNSLPPISFSGSPPTIHIPETSPLMTQNQQFQQSNTVTILSDELITGTYQ